MPDRRLIAADDLFHVRLIGDPQGSPTGSQVVWTDTSMHKDDDVYRSAIWIAGIDGTNARKLTAGTARDTAPRWSPQGDRIAFLSNRAPMMPVAPVDEPRDTPKNAKPVSQVWVIDVEGGEARQVTNARSGIESATWSPDGGTIAYAAQSDQPGDAGYDAPTVRGEIADERVINHIRYRFDGRGFIERFSHIWTIAFDGGEPTQVTFGDVFDREPAWSPDGATVAFVGNRRADRHDLVTASTILVVPAMGGDVRTLAPDDATFAEPMWSPDGQRIAFTGHLDARSGGARHDHLWTADVSTGEAIDHTDGWDVSVGDAGMSDLFSAGSTRPIWIGNDRILVAASNLGATHVYTVSVDGGSPAALTSGPHRVAGFTVAGDMLVVQRGSIASPFELFTVPLSGSEVSTLTTANAAWRDEVTLLDAVELEVAAADGQTIQTWLLPPAGYDPESTVKYPLILQIHGGPHSMYAYAPFHEMQLMAAKGYAVLFCNPRGSAGYGEAFVGSTRGRWGATDMPDVIAAVEVAVELPWVDRTRLGITGGSYGGYLTNWIIGHDTRFRAAVTQRCVSNFYSFFGTSDIGTTFGVHEFDGVPWADAEKLLEHSPISYVDHFETPLLILHSEQDLRCPIEQAEQMFAALRYLGKDVSFVRIPDESHDLSRSGTPSRRLARLHHLIGWFDRHL